MALLRRSPLERLADAIQYPEEIPQASDGFIFHVDDLYLHASAVGQQVVLRCMLACPEEAVVTFAQYAAGRFLREAATLAWDAREGAMYLWQRFDTAAEDDTLRQDFEAFADACEWWLARTREVDTPVSVFPDILIRP